MEMMLESYFNMHYYGYGIKYYESDCESESDSEETDQETKSEQMVIREFPFHDDVLYINIKAPRAKTGWENLPMELLIHIFSFIRPSDRNSAALTCHRWFEALRHPMFLDATCFHFERIEVTDNKSPIQIFLDSFRHFTNIKLTKVKFSGQTEFWNYFGVHIREITFDNCALTKPKLSNILGTLPNLERLNLVDCDELFKSWHPVHFTDISPICKRLKHLGLRKNNAFNEDHLNYLVAMAPRINSLEISKCLKEQDAGKRLQILSHVLRILKLHKHQMRSVNFSYTMYDDLFLKQFAEIENMSLCNISLSFFDRAPIKDPSIIEVLRKHTNLVHLDLTSFLNLTDFALIEIAHSMPLLKTLKLNGCWLLTDFGISEVRKLRNLVVLDLSDCDRVTDVGFLNAIVDKNRTNLRELYLSMLPGISENVILKICLTLINLTVLDFCGSDCINDTSIQYVFCYLRFVRILRLNGCVKVSDAGLTGIELQRVAIEIWDQQQTFSIDMLQGLQELQISGCFKVTDFALKQAFKLVELKEINLSHCVHITEEGIEAMALNCPSLEAIDLSDCYHINNRCIDLLSKHLFRLSSLKLVRLPSLTIESINSILANCKLLKNINLRGCSKLPRDAIDLLAKLKTLRNFPKY
ncbi:F-box/LRR-repeat protein 20-like isoform X2 [Topomyia yanbarensis]|uniref:F-box/LRR-repeat protein 20-like isoform X2 n=1 Tax=Topomyia yanbarensis TaxID=2498891 RepID=UPI00273AA590|nr:F-box/LRR-repeat protein 20-like isoform X2 [Topomyia yanbarensis]XP_058832848.1 F-box/LRR-repeat protein 20-like isoform X2 [Topomyia yanbarensis]